MSEINEKPWGERSLTPRAMELLQASADDRIAYLRRDMWIDYPAANSATRLLKELLAAPPTIRPTNILFHGETNNGKSSIISHFLEKHPASENRSEDYATVPIISIEAPAKPDEARFYKLILDKVKVPYKTKDTDEAFESSVLNAITKFDTRLLIIDEIHNLVDAPSAKITAFLKVLRRLTNQSKVPIAAFGISTALTVFKTDPQLMSRFYSFELPIWPKEAPHEYARLLAGFERHLPLEEKSNLAHPVMASEILARTGGLLGETSTLVRLLAQDAIEREARKITLEQVQEMPWATPDQPLGARLARNRALSPRKKA